MTPSIPGFTRVSFKALELMFTLAVERPKNLTCDVWEQAASQVPHFGLHELPWKLIEASVMLVKRESFLGGVCFDLPNLKTQIMSVRISGNSNDDVTNPGNLKTSQSNMTGTSSTSGHYCPQYSHIKDILGQARNQRELDSLKNLACTLADVYLAIVAQHIAKRGPDSPVTPGLENTADTIFSPTHSYFSDLFDNCTCSGDKRNVHQKVLKNFIEINEGLRKNFLAKLASTFPRQRNLNDYDGIHGINMTFISQYTGVFISRLGFFGVSFQRQPDLKKGNKIVVLDGIPPPMILEETGDGATYRMKAVADVVGIKHVDIARLAELGVFRRRDYKIV
jgi:hypothetical protein